MIRTSADEIVSRCNTLLNDEGYIRWPKQELIDYLNDAQKAVVLRRPDSSSGNKTLECVAGTSQRLPEDCYRLIDVTHNVNGSSITGPYEKRLLDEIDDQWYSSAGNPEVELFVYDERNPRVLYVYPGVAAGAEINLVCSIPPHKITIENSAEASISVTSNFDNALIEWVLYRCNVKDSEFASNSTKAQLHLNAFKAQLGEKSQADGAMAAEQIKD